MKETGLQDRGSADCDQPQRNTVAAIIKAATAQLYARMLLGIQLRSL
jgi:hypothetical protein